MADADSSNIKSDAEISSTRSVGEPGSSSDTAVKGVFQARPGWFIAGAVLGVMAIFGGLWMGWNREAAFMAGILVIAAVWWVTEAIPLHVTSLMIIALEILLLANPGKWPGLGFESGQGTTLDRLLAAAVDPILLLFFGGLVLARACVNEGVDRVLSSFLLRPFGQRPRFVLLGILLVTAFLSMWMSNTATAALVMTLVGPVAMRLAPKDPFRTALFLAVPVGANLGGMGTPIASPPNAIAVKYLSGAGISIGFGSWMVIAVPIMAVLLLFAWFMLWRWYPCTAIQVDLLKTRPQLTKRGRLVLLTFGVTVLLWLTEGWHGLPSSYVGLFPALVLAGVGIVSREDIQRLEWSVLILISGGIALGVGMQITGLDRQVVGWLPMGETTGPAILSLGMTSLALVLAVFMSNTAAANLVIPVAMASVVVATGGVSNAASAGQIVQLGMSISLAVGGAMLLPSSTPPNAIAYASGEFSTKDLMRIGFVVATLTLILSQTVMGTLIRWVMGTGN